MSRPSPARRLIRRLGFGPTLRSILAIRPIDTSRLHAWPERIHLSRLLPLLGVDCMFDVGANEGQYARMLRQHAGYRGQIVSFEPIPELASMLRTKAAGDPKWRIEEIALATGQGQHSFNVMKDCAFSSLSAPRHEEVGIFREQNLPVRQIPVKTDSLSGAFRRLRTELGFTRPFLKLDTQGFDVEIVKHGRDVMPEFVGFQSELAVKRIYEDSVDFRQAIGFYQDLGFEVSALVPNNAGRRTFPVLVEIDCIMVRAGLLGLSRPEAGGGSAADQMPALRNEPGSG